MTSPYENDGFEEDEGAQLEGQQRRATTTTTTTTKTSFINAEQTAARRNDDRENEEEEDGFTEDYHGHDGEDAANFTALRETEEYRAAWDLEVWRALKLKQLDEELAEHRKKAMTHFRASLAVKEQTELAAIEREKKELAIVQRRAQDEMKDIDIRKRKLLEIDKELRTQQAKVSHDAKRWEADSNAKVQAAKEECAQKVTLMMERVKAYEEQWKRSEERLRQTQDELMKCQEAFGAFRTQQLTAGQGGILDLHVEKLRTQHQADLTAMENRLQVRFDDRLAALQRRNEALEEENKKLSASNLKKKSIIAQLEREVQRLQEEQAREQVRHDIERQRREHEALANAAKAEGLMTDRSQWPDELERAALLRSVKVAADRVFVYPSEDPAATPHHNTRNAVVRAPAEGSGGGLSSSSGGAAAAPPSSHHPAFSSSSTSNSTSAFVLLQQDAEQAKAFERQQANLRSEIQRLEQSRRSLLEDYGGVYTDQSSLVQQLDKEIAQLQSRLLLVSRQDRPHEMVAAQRVEKRSERIRR